MAELAHNIVTVAELREWIGIPQGPSTREADALEIIANGVTEAIEGHCRRRIVARQRTEYFDGDGTRELALNRRPIVTLNALERLYSDGTVAETYAVSDYLLDNAVGRVMLWTKHFPFGRKNIRATLAEGWEFANVPADVKLAARLWAHKHFKDWNGGQTEDEIVSQSISGQTTTFFVGPIPKKVEALLKRYRDPIFY